MRPVVATLMMYILVLRRQFLASEAHELFMAITVGPETPGGMRGGSEASTVEESLRALMECLLISI